MAEHSASLVALWRSTKGACWIMIFLSRPRLSLVKIRGLLVSPFGRGAQIRKTNILLSLPTEPWVVKVLALFWVKRTEIVMSNSYTKLFWVLYEAISTDRFVYEMGIRAEKTLHRWRNAELHSEELSVPLNVS